MGHKGQVCYLSIRWLEIKCIVSGKIKTLQKRIKQLPHPVLTNPEVVCFLKDMHGKYVFALTNKASNDVIITRW